MDRKKAYKHDYSGSCAPTHPYAGGSFSVGIFQWVPKASGKGLKKTAVKYRVKGFSSNPEPVYARAEEICRMFDEGKDLGKKSEFVRG